MLSNRGQASHSSVFTSVSASIFIMPVRWARNTARTACRSARASQRMQCSRSPTARQPWQYARAVTQQHGYYHLRTSNATVLYYPLPPYVPCNRARQPRRNVLPRPETRTRHITPLKVHVNRFGHFAFMTRPHSTHELSTRKQGQDPMNAITSAERITIVGSS